MGNIFSDFYFNETHKLKIFGTLVYYDNQVKKGIENFSVNDIANKVRQNNIEISNKNIYEIIKKYYLKGQFIDLYYKFVDDNEF
ncbi:hypothetical protein [Staphylococcus nepalensis]|uniref:hypothetical protein n=1 Tax=Staphylococcus nepalensis TaxID=214473 RepID=UPI0031BA5421